MTWILDTSRTNEIGYVKAFKTKQELADFMDFVQMLDFKITDNINEMIEYCVQRGLDWQKFKN